VNLVTTTITRVQLGKVLRQGEIEDSGIFAGYAGVRTITGLAAVTLLMALLGATAFATTSFARVGPPVACFDSTTGR
jgi:hypothetical protein